MPLNAGFTHRWRALVSLSRQDPLSAASVVVAIALTLWFGLPVVESLNSIWLADTDYTHGYLAFALTAVLVYFEFRRKPVTPIAPSWLGATFFVALVFLVIAARAATTDVVAQLALPALWVGVIWALTGGHNASRFVAPFSYTIFAVPIWNLLIDPMRELTIRVVSMWTRAAGMPAFIEGNLIHVPTGTFEVQGGCAGLRYMLVAGALTVFTSLLHKRRLSSVVLLISVAGLLALIGNWVRVFLTVAAGLSPEGPMALFVHNNHTLFGWLLFIVFMVPVFYLDRAMELRQTAEPGDQAMRSPGSYFGNWRNTIAYTVCVFLALGIWLGDRVADGAPSAPSSVPVLPERIAGWSRTVEWQDARLPVFIGTNQQVAAWYSNGASEIGAYVANYTIQRQEHEVVFFHNRPGGASAAVAAQRSLVKNAGASGPISFRELEVVDSENQRRLIWLGLNVAGWRTANDFAAKALQVLGAIRGRRDAQAVVLSASCGAGADCGQARSQLSEFAVSGADQLFAAAAGAVPAPRSAELSQ